MNSGVLTLFVEGGGRVVLKRLRSARWKAKAIGRATYHTHRRPRSQRHSRKEEEREESTLMSYDGSRENEQFLLTLSSQETAASRRAPTTMTVTGTRVREQEVVTIRHRRRRPSSRRKGKEEVGIPVGTGDGFPTRRRAIFGVD